ncbi:MAG: glycosyltransferase family 4 protein, partial [Patescibacteria group bacterium]
VEFDREAFKQRYSLKQNVVMTMARLVPWKGVGTLIESMRDVLAAHPGTTLAIAGTGPSEGALKRLVHDEKLGDSVVFLGNVTIAEEKQKLYGITDVFVLNTFYESMSNVLLEAMSAGCAVVTTRAGGNPEFVDAQNGVLVHYNDKKQIAAAVTKLLDDQIIRQRLGENALQTASQFTPENFVNENISLLKGVQEMYILKRE